MATGSFEDLKTKLLNNKKYEAVLVIGHEPILGDWSHKLSGSKLAFPKGAAAAFFLSEDCDKAELFWYMHPKYLIKK